MCVACHIETAIFQGGDNFNLMIHLSFKLVFSLLGVDYSEQNNKKRKQNKRTEALEETSQEEGTENIFSLET